MKIDSYLWAESKNAINEFTGTINLKDLHFINMIDQ